MPITAGKLQAEQQQQERKRRLRYQLAELQKGQNLALRVQNKIRILTARLRRSLKAGKRENSHKGTGIKSKDDELVLCDRLIAFRIWPDEDHVARSPAQRDDEGSDDGQSQEVGEHPVAVVRVRARTGARREITGHAHTAAVREDLETHAHTHTVDHVKQWIKTFFVFACDTWKRVELSAAPSWPGVVWTGSQDWQITYADILFESLCTYNLVQIKEVCFYIIFWKKIL